MKKALILSVAVLAASTAAQAGVPALPIPHQPGQPVLPAYIGAPFTAAPVETYAVPEHPFMAPNGRSNMHNDAYMTDTYVQAGPLGIDPRVTSTWLGLEECASVTFDSQGRIMGLCGSLDGARLRLLDATSLDTLAVLQLPPRSIRPGTTPLTDYCAAGYFYLDNSDRGIVSTNNNQVWVVSAHEPTFLIEGIYDLVRHVPPPDCLVSVLPDWHGRLWFVSRGGIVGTIDPSSGQIQTMATGELVANSFAVDDTGGVFIITDHQMYRFDAAPGGAPSVTWSFAYDRGSQIKPGMLSQGSGTSPTLIGEEYVAIADNADPQMHIEVYRRTAASGGAFVCRAAVFDPGTSTTENSLISIGNAIIAENNYGYTSPLDTANGRSVTGGIARVDFDPETGTCSNVWESDEISPTTVPKASAGSGLIYVYTKPPREDGGDGWYFTAIDLATGETAYKVLTGVGYLSNNHYAPVTIGPDGAAYVGALGGLIRIEDTLAAD